MFSDESRFCLSNQDGRIRVYRRAGERYRDGCVLQRDRYGGASVMVWGAINTNFRSRLVIVNGNLNAIRYVGEILQPHLLPLLAQHGGNNRLLFQHDNARPLVARYSQLFLQQNGVHVIRWPALSPDMNCIEHLWDVLGRMVDEQRTRVDCRSATGLAANPDGYYPSSDHVHACPIAGVCSCQWWAHQILTFHMIFNNRSVANGLVLG